MEIGAELDRWRSCFGEVRGDGNEEVLYGISSNVVLMLTENFPLRC